MVAKRQEETLVIQASSEVQIISEISHRLYSRSIPDSYLNHPGPLKTEQHS